MLKKLRDWLAKPFISWLNSERPYEGIPLCDFERIRYEVRLGDVLLIEGRSRVSDIIRSVTNSSWSHSALYIGRLHDIEDPKIRNLLSVHYQGPADAQLIIEGMMGEGIIVKRLSVYKNEHIRLCRPKGLSSQDAQSIIAYAVHELGKDYDVRQILDLARFLLPWSFMPKRFRSKLFELNAGASTKTVCSTMIAEAFTSVQFPVLPLAKANKNKDVELIMRNPKLCTPRDFDYSPYFDIIKYPFIDYGLYRKLPWNKDGLVSHDEAGISSLNEKVESTTKKSKKKVSVLNNFKSRFNKEETNLDNEPQSSDSEDPKKTDDS